MRGGRARWGLFGLLLVAVAVGGVLAGQGALGTASSHSAIVPESVVTLWHRNSSLSLLGAGIVALVVALVGLALARSPFRRVGHARLDDYALAPSGGGSARRGTTKVRSASLSHALEADLERAPGVERALVGLRGAAPEVELRAVLDIADRAEPTTVLAQAGEAVERMARTGALRPSPVSLALRPVEGARRALH